MQTFMDLIMLCKFYYCPECYLGQQFDEGERESKNFISASLLAGTLEKFKCHKILGTP